MPVRRPVGGEVAGGPALAQGGCVRPGGEEEFGELLALAAGVARCAHGPSVAYRQNERMPSVDEVIARIQFNDAGLVPAVAQQWDSREVLMLAWMDEAAVSTIHGWCNRMLHEHAFDSLSLFTQTLETDPSDLRAEVVRDYWRQWYYPLTPDALRQITAYWQHPSALETAESTRAPP